MSWLDCVQVVVLFLAGYVFARLVSRFAQTSLVAKIQHWYWFRCKDCGRNTADEYYAVDNAIWKKFGARKRMLCIGCLEGRMGRELTKADFIDAPVNDLTGLFSYKSARFVDRLGKEGK